MYLLLLFLLFGSTTFAEAITSNPSTYVIQYNDSANKKININRIFDHINPNAPKGGTIIIGDTGKFDSLNYFSSNAPFYSTVINATLAKKIDETSGYYHGLIAETIDLSYQNHYITFTIRPEAKFNDGTPITAEDVAFSFLTLKKASKKNGNNYYKFIDTYIIKSEKEIKFIMNTNANKNAYFELCSMPILSKIFWQNYDFTKKLTEIPIISGPYEISDFQFNSYITYTKLDNWWGDNLLFLQGQYNFDTVKIKYYQDYDEFYKAFKEQQYDILLSSGTELKKYSTIIDKGKVKIKALKDVLVHGMEGLVFNTRREIFKNIKVREALTYTFNFAHLQNKLAPLDIIRPKSYFNNSELGATGKPSPEELKLLLPFKYQLDPRVFTQEYIPPIAPKISSTPESLSSNLNKAIDLLNQAGWIINDQNIMVNETTKQPFEFEIILNDEETNTEAKLLANNLKLIGIKVILTTLEPKQYADRYKNFNYDMVYAYWHTTSSPGAELINSFSTESAQQNGSLNYSGINNNAVDYMLYKIINAKNKKELVIAAKALDRILRWSIIVIPTSYFDNLQIAYWENISIPKNINNLSIDSFWSAKLKLKKNKRIKKSKDEACAIIN